VCRSIKRLREGNVPAADDDISAAALQFVRKISGYRKPSAENAEAFDDAVREISGSSSRLLARITEKRRGPGRSGAS